MALSAKWLDGDLVFHDGSQEVYRLKNSTEGIVVGTNMTYPDPTTLTSTSTVTLTATSNRIQFLKTTTTGGINILAPEAASGNAGIEFKIFNNSTGAYDMTVYNGSTSNGSIAVISPNEGAIVISDGTEWRKILGST